MTNTELKAQIDSQITNETTPNGITPTDVGTNLKAVVDYVDQETEIVINSFVTKQVKVNVSQSDISTLHTTGKLLFSNLDETVKIIPLSYYFKKQSGTVYSSDFNTFTVLDENNNTYQTINHPFLTNIGGFMIVNSSTNFHSNMTDLNTDLVLKSASAFTGGTNGFDVYLTYAEITL